MHDALWVDDHVDLSGLQVEEPTGFDDLQSLVHQCGRIDGDLFPHDPRRVPKGLLWGDTAEALSRTLAKRAARGGQKNPLQVRAIVSRQTLEDRRWLTIHRKKADAMGL